MYSFSFELFAKPTIKTKDEITIKNKIAGLNPISLAVNAKKERNNIKWGNEFNKTKFKWALVKVF